MSIKYMFQCFISLLFFNYVASTFIIDSHKDELENNDNVVYDLSNDELPNFKVKVMSILVKIVELEDMLKNKGNNESEDNFLEYLEKRMHFYREALSTNKALDKINDQLVVLKLRLQEHMVNIDIDKKIPSSTTASNLDVNGMLESMASKLEKDFIASNELYNKNIFKKEIPKLDDLDRSMINKTGCKYLSLKYKDIQIYKTNESMNLVTMVYQQLSAYRYVRRVDFETHFAIRSTGNIYVLLWEHDVEHSEKLSPDYEIGLGVQVNSTDTIFSLKIRNDDFWKQAAPKVMSHDKYEKFYIKMYNDTLEFGSKCDKPFHIHATRRRGSIMYIGFLSSSIDGATVLVDCPAATCADST